jgi:hypothetical protein
MNDTTFYRALFDYFIDKHGDPAFRIQKGWSFRPGQLIGDCKLTALQWYNLYIEKCRIRNERRKLGLIELKEGVFIPYPFKTKLGRYRRLDNNVIEELTPTDTYISKTEFARPNFSKYFGSWEIDIAYYLIDPNSDARYLFCINMNSRYLFVERIESNASRGLVQCLEGILFQLHRMYERQFANNDDKWLQELIEHPIRYLKGDGDVLFRSGLTHNFLEQYEIQTCWESSPFTFHNKLVDAVIKTIRNAIGYRIINDQQLQEIVNYYNNTYHKGIDCTPREMLLNPEYEEQYIRHCMSRLVQALQKQEEAGLFNYVPGNVLLLHCDVRKTPAKNEKRRKFWDRMGIFVGYVHGNVVVDLLKNQRPIGKLTRISVPVYYTRKIADDIDLLPKMYTNTYST